MKLNESIMFEFDGEKITKVKGPMTGTKKTWFVTVFKEDLEDVDKLIFEFK